jgi:hypothetical protein
LCAPGGSGDKGIAFERCRGVAQGDSGHVESKVQLYIDGVRATMVRPKGLSQPSLAREGDLDPTSEALKLVSVKDIEFMEVYRGTAQIPAEFLNDACAVIAIWTKQY